MTNEKLTSKKIFREGYNIILDGKTKTLEKGKENEYLLNDYKRYNGLPTITHRLVIDDRIRPTNFSLIESKGIWKEILRELYHLWNKENLIFDNKEMKEAFFEECNSYLIER